MNYSILEKLTIIIYTYNRHQYLRRALDHWCNYNSKLVILDGSDKKFEDPRLEKKNIKYIYDTKGLYNRLLSSVKYIETEFMILAADDEFYLPSALCSCINFLMKNEAYSSCGGRAIGFGLDNEKKIFGKQVYQKLRNLTLDHESSNNRIIQHFSNYVPAHFYSVIKSNKWKKICPYVFHKKYDFFGSIELQVEFLIIISGKSKMIPELMWMRSHGVAQLVFNLPQIKIQDWWIKKKFQNEKSLFLKTLKKASNEFTNEQSVLYTEDTVTKIFETYIKENFDEKNFFIKLLLFLKIKEIKKFMYSFFKIKTKSYKNLIDEVNILESESVVVNYKDLNQIISIVKNSITKN